VVDHRESPVEGLMTKQLRLLALAVHQMAYLQVGLAVRWRHAHD